MREDGVSQVSRGKLRPARASYSPWGRADRLALGDLADLDRRA